MVFVVSDESLQGRFNPQGKTTVNFVDDKGYPKASLVVQSYLLPQMCRPVAENLADALNGRGARLDIRLDGNSRFLYSRSDDGVALHRRIDGVSQPIIGVFYDENIDPDLKSEVNRKLGAGALLTLCAQMDGFRPPAPQGDGGGPRHGKAF